LQSFSNPIKETVSRYVKTVLLWIFVILNLSKNSDIFDSLHVDKTKGDLHCRELRCSLGAAMLSGECAGQLYGKPGFASRPAPFTLFSSPCRKTQLQDRNFETQQQKISSAAKRVKVRAPKI
jgi:hypothetical protein